jgi:sugar (glycoside-pentoside-hexuronide) transporter
VEKRLPGLVVNSYGFANFTKAIMLSLAMNYYAIFLTDVAFITAVHMGTLMLITHLVDAISIPLIGSLIQKTQMRWGKFRSWFLFMPLSTCVFFTLTFTNLPLSYGLKLIYLSLAYMIAHVSLNFAYNAHLGMISVLSSSVEDRLYLSARNIQFGMASTILYSLVIIPILTYLCSKNPTWGYFYTVGTLAVFQVFGYWNLFYQTRNYEKYDPTKNLDSANKISLWEMVSQVIGNKQLLFLISADTFTNVSLFTLSTFAIYYFKYISNFEVWMTFHTLALSIVAFSSSIISPFVIRKFGKKRTYLFAVSWSTAAFLVLRVFGASSPYIYTAILCLSGIISGTAGPMRQAMYMDAAEYSYYKTGKDASAFVMSMFTIPIKVGIALATTLAGYGLAIIGYVPNMVATPEFTSNLMDIICFIPAGCGVIALIIMSFYSLTETNLSNYMEANKLKRAAAKT